MLEQLEKDWTAAINSSDRRAIHTTRVPGTDIIKTQKFAFKFRGIDAVVDMELFRGDETREPKDRRYRVVVQVPSTNKQIVIKPREWKSRVDRMMSILLTFQPGRDHEDKIAIRRQRAVIHANEKIVASYRSKFDNTSFDDAERDLIVKWLDEHTNPRKFSWNEALLDVVTSYHQYITGRGLIEVGINLGQDSKWHVKRCYDTCAKIISASTHSNGKRYLSRVAANGLFLENKEVPFAIYVIRSMYAKIWDKCYKHDPVDGAMVFSWVADCLGAYYAYVTGISVDDHCADLQKRFIEARNRAMARRLNGDNSKRFKEEPVSDIMTIGDAFGDVLDKAQARISGKKQESKKREEDKSEEEHTSKPKLKIRTPVVVTETVDEEEDTQPGETLPEPPSEIKIDETPQGALGSLDEAFKNASLM